MQETLDRETIFLAQTPQGFRREVLAAAVALGQSGVEATDEAALAERAGYAVHVVPGESNNIKITTPEDLDAVAAGRGPARTGRAGIGYDLHRLVAGRPLVLGGVTIPSERGALGHSDADVVCHAATDAILGAVSLGDIGLHFPDSDARWKDARSLDLLRQAVAMAAGARIRGRQRRRDRHARVAEAARLHRSDPGVPRDRAVGIDAGQVSVKAKTNEGYGRDWTRRGDRRPRDCTATPGLKRPAYGVECRVQKDPAYRRTVGRVLLDPPDTMRVRFAPSPTGQLHVGNARTALFNWLLARGSDGIFMLRFEDTDAERSTRESEAAIVRDLRWLGLDWDEGPDVGGPCGPYRQSERLHLYQSYAKELLGAESAYYCFCSTAQLEADRQAAVEAGRPVQYAGTCRHLSHDEVRMRIAAGEHPAIRFRVPEGSDVVFKDAVRGEVRFQGDVIGDPVILRADGTPAYNFAVVVDDALMEVTHVIRGEDHLSNTPRQILLYEALGFSPPQFAHLALVLGPDHSPLSKRHGATSVAEFRAKGYLPEALVNYLALDRLVAASARPPGDRSPETMPSCCRLRSWPAVFPSTGWGTAPASSTKRSWRGPIATI